MVRHHYPLSEEAEVDFSQDRCLPKRRRSLARARSTGAFGPSCSYLDVGEPVVSLGDSGTARANLLIGLGMPPAEQGRRVRYATAARLVNETRRGRR